VGLLHTLYCYLGKYASKNKLAAEASLVEIEKIGSPIGKQDQYAAALGGLNFIQFNKDGTVSSQPVMVTAEIGRQLKSNLILYYLGSTRSANVILSEQKKNMNDEVKTANLAKMCELTWDMKAALEAGDLDSFGGILHESWMLKRTLASGISNPEIDELYDRARLAGAIGGKLLGAGGGGFFLFFCPPAKQECLRLTLGLRPFDFNFEYDGTSVVYIGDKYWN
jgi:Predicted kinase related to galactokinase and mevalonate kinase